MMISVKELKRNYGPVQALRGIDFEIGRGQVVGLLGPNGAGKTTTIKILTCFIHATSGTARVGGYDVRTHPFEVRRQIGYLPEDAPLYSDMLVSEHLEFAAGVREIPKGDRSRRYRQVVEQCGIGEVWRRKIGQLSRGLRQRVGLAQAMLHEPEILILDEPTSGLDPNQIAEIREVIKEIGRERTVVLSTHILSEVEMSCNRAIIINVGQIVADGDIATLRQGDVLVARIRGPEFSVRDGLQGIDGVDSVSSRLVDGELRAYRIKTSRNAESLCERVYATVSSNDWVLAELRVESTRLEDLFRELTVIN